MVRRSVLDRVGDFALGLSTVQDWDLWLRVAREHRIARVDEVLAHYRQHSGGMSQNWKRTHDEALSLLAQHPASGTHGGPARVRELAAYQAFDHARSAVHGRRPWEAARCLSFVARTKPRLLVNAVCR